MMNMLVLSKIAKFAYNFLGACILWASALSLMMIGLDGAEGMGLGMVMIFGGPVLLIVTPFVLWSLQSLLSEAINKTETAQGHIKFGIAFIMLFAFLPLLLPAWYQTWYVPAIVAIIMIVWSIPVVLLGKRNKRKASNEKQYK